MRYAEIAVRVPVSNEEMILLDLAKDGVIKAEDLDERQLELTRGLVSRGVLNRYKDGVFVLASHEIWRD